MISLSACFKIMKEAGAKRVSYEAMEILQEALEGIGEQISKDAILLAEHDKRTTVKAKDIRLSLELTYSSKRKKASD